MHVWVAENKCIFHVNMSLQLFYGTGKIPWLPKSKSNILRGHLALPWQSPELCQGVQWYMEVELSIRVLNKSLSFQT